MRDRDEELRRAADVFEILSNPKRLRILHILEGGERTVGEISSRVDLNQPTVSRHLRRMADRDVLESRRQGVNVYYGVSDDRVIDLVSLGRSFASDRHRSDEQTA